MNCFWCLNVWFTLSKYIICETEILCFNGDVSDDSDDRFCNFLYRITFTPRLNVISLYESCYFYRHYRHNLAQKES